MDKTKKPEQPKQNTQSVAFKSAQSKGVDFKSKFRASPYSNRGFNPATFKIQHKG